MGAVCSMRPGRPDIGVRTSRFEPLSCVLGPWAVHRFQQRLRRL